MKLYTYYNRSNTTGVRCFRAVLCLLLTLIIAAAVVPVQAFAAQPPAAIDGNAAILVDPRTETVLYEQNADVSVAPASTTKIMTGLLVVEAVQRGQISMTDMVVLTDEIMHNVPSDASRIGKAMVVGEQVSVRDLLNMALMESDCVACDMLAVHVSGSVAAFVSQMNQRAQQLGCRDTNFVNCHGYPQDGHTSTARSLYLITAEASKHQLFMDAFGCLKYTVPATNMSDSRTIYSTDKLLYDPAIVTSTYTVYFNEHVTGGKTGYSKASGNCLVSTAEKDGMQLISVITGVEMKYPDDQTVVDAFTETSRLLAWGFDNFTSHRMVIEGETINTVAVENGVLESVAAISTEDMYVTLEKGQAKESVQVTSSLMAETVQAPVSSGDVMGTVSLMKDGKVLASAELVAGADNAVAPKVFQPNVPLIIILSIIVAAGAAYLVYYTNKNNILLVDYAREKLGAGNTRPQTRPAAKARPVYEEEEDEEEETADNPFEELFARNRMEE